MALLIITSGASSSSSGQQDEQARRHTGSQLTASQPALPEPRSQVLLHSTPTALQLARREGKGKGLSESENGSTWKSSHFSHAKHGTFGCRRLTLCLPACLSAVCLSVCTQVFLTSRRPPSLSTVALDQNNYLLPVCPVVVLQRPCWYALSHRPQTLELSAPNAPTPLIYATTTTTTTNNCLFNPTWPPRDITSLQLRGWPQLWIPPPGNPISLPPLMHSSARVTKTGKTGCAGIPPPTQLRPRMTFPSPVPARMTRLFKHLSFLLAISTSSA